MRVGDLTEAEGRERQEQMRALRERASSSIVLGRHARHARGGSVLGAVLGEFLRVTSADSARRSDPARRS